MSTPWIPDEPFVPSPDGVPHLAKGMITPFKVVASKTQAADVGAWMAKPEGAPPFQNVGGYNAMDPNATGWIDLDLTPGQYVAICHVPDPASGKPHDALGMVLPFTVK